MWCGCNSLQLLCWNAAVVFWAASAADLDDDLYALAKKSKYMVELNRESFDGFLGNAAEPYQVVFFHLSTCSICKSALPRLEQIAREFSERELPIVIGHVECSSGKAFWEGRFGFSGFPNLLLWHRPSDDQQNDGLALTELVGSHVRVTGDKQLLLEASQKAEMSAKKDAQRLKGLGQEAEVLDVALEDLTAKLKVLKSGVQVWFPLEALVAAEGSKPVPPINRPTRVAYKPTSWKLEAMQDFIERSMRPPVIILDDPLNLNKDLKNETLAALVLCAPEMNPRFLALARSWQDKHRAFHAPSPDACPVAGADAGPRLVIYSPPTQQWAAKGSPSAGVLVAGASVLNDDNTDLAAWFKIHRFPGILHVTYDNFPELMHAERNIVVIAADLSSPKQKKLVQQKIREAAAPKKSKKKMPGGGPDVYSYSSNSTYWGVVDGMLNGLNSFGVSQWSLPRVVIFEKGHTWVEDDELLTVDNLIADLARADELWRMQGGIYGWILYIARMLWRSFKLYDSLADQMGGMPMRIMVCLFWIAMPVFMIRSMHRNFMADDAPEQPKED